MKTDTTLRRHLIRAYSTRHAANGHFVVSIPFVGSFLMSEQRLLQHGGHRALADKMLGKRLCAATLAATLGERLKPGMCRRMAKKGDFK